MKRLLCGLLLICVLLSGCATGQGTPEQKQYNATFLTLFDTVTTIVGKAENKEEFQKTAQQIHDSLLEYHQLFDIYNDYDGVTGLKAVNDAAGQSPVQVDRRIIDLLLDCKRYYALTGGKVNPAMGSVLQLWHEARNDGINDPVHAYLPNQQALENAAQHTDFDCVVIDEAVGTVYITDPKVRLDVGAIAKGWSVQRVCETSPEGLLVSVCGNVCATGPKDAQGTPWVIGIQNPDGGSDYLHTVYLSRGSVVTSGDYQRAYRVGDQIYHHIIDPETLYPSTYWRSVTIVCDDSGLADALSTALFLLPLEEGRELAGKCEAQVMWVDGSGQIYYTTGFESMIRT
jgi:thiamine biosynthesis lipoprotein